MVNQDNLTSVLTYIDKGWLVHPLHDFLPTGDCSCGDFDCRSPGKHPRLKNWPTIATLSPKQANEWWQEWPRANIGIVTGAKSKLALTTRPPTVARRTLAWITFQIPARTPEVSSAPTRTNTITTSYRRSTRTSTIRLPSPQAFTRPQALLTLTTRILGVS